MMFLICDRKLLLLIGLFTVKSFVECFNFDTKNPIIYKGPTDSYFGYTTAILRNNDGTWILVGAPRGDDKFQPFVTRPGALYRCPYPPPANITSSSCSQINVDSKGESEQTITYKVRNVTLHHQKTDQWLGVSLDVDPVNHSSVLVCAHRWRDTHLYHKMGGITHMNGMCYLLEGTLKEEGRLIPAMTVTKRLINRDRYAEFSMGTLGMASMITKEHLLMTVPGMNDWSGGLVIDDRKQMTNVRYIEPTRRFHQDNYIGYSIATGNFIYRNSKSVALGAPRVEKVFIYPLSMSSKGTSSSMPLATISGEQIGSYFGAAISTIYLNGNKMAALLIGAPMFADGGIDQGRVFLYRSRGIFGFERDKEPLHGTNASYGRFGSAIAVLGDINNDGFDDIAIGAPYEETSGVVYIYNGFIGGIFPEFTQRIGSRELQEGLSGFGISFSKPFDIDKNGINDFAVGAYASDHMVLLRGRRPINVQPIFQFNPQEISRNVTCQVLGRKVLCFEVYVCFHYTNILPYNNTIDINYTITIDSDRSYAQRRAVVIDLSGNQIQHLTSYSGSTTVAENKVTCSYPKMIYLKKDIIESFQPINFEIEIALRKTNCKRCPVMNIFNGSSNFPLKRQGYSANIPFQIRCQHTQKCESNLSIKGQLLQNDMIHSQRSTYGESTAVKLLINISNAGDIATDLLIVTKLSHYVQYFKVYNFLSKKVVYCSSMLNEMSTNMTFSCPLGNLKFWNSLSIVVELSSKISFPDLLQMETKLTTTSKSADSSKMSLAIAFPVSLTPSILFFGVTKPEEMVVQKESENNGNRTNDDLFIHIYKLFNDGPPPIVNGSLIIYIEAKYIHVVNIVNITNTSQNGATAKCKVIQHSPESIRWQHMNNSQVKLLECIIGKQSAMESLTFSVTMQLMTSSIQMENVRTKVLDIHTFATFGLGYPHEMDNQRAEVMTRMIFVSWSQFDVSAAYWIISLSAFLGFALLLIISVSVWKCGFFTRKDKDTLHRLIQRRNLMIARAFTIETPTLLEDDDSSDTLVMTPPPSYQEVNHSWNNSAASSPIETIQISEFSTEYLEPVQTLV